MLRLIASLAAIFALAGCAGTTPPADAGTIHFGSDVDVDTFQLVGPEKTEFGATDNWAYVAVLSEPAYAFSLPMVVSKVVGAGEEAVLQDSLSVADPDSQTIVGELPMRALLSLSGPGTYTMRVLRDYSTTILAQGSFTFV